jgi:hypothetical protein
MALSTGRPAKHTPPGTPPNPPRSCHQGSRVKHGFNCGHRGLGAFCHRCQRAETLEVRVKEGVFVSFYKNEAGFPAKSSRKATKAELLAMIAEIAHLRVRAGEKALPTERVQAELLGAGAVFAEDKKPVKAKPTIDTLAQKFSEQGAVSKKTLKVKS